MSDTQAITAPAKEWIAALTRLTPAMAGRKPTPILSSIIVDPSEQSVFGFDYATSASTAIQDASGIGDPFLVHWRWLLDAIRSTTGRARNMPVTAKMVGNKVTVSAAGYELHTESADIGEYPSAPESPNEVEATFPATEFRTALRRVKVAACADDTLPILSAVQFNIRGGNVEMFATDRYRLTTDHVAGIGEGETSFVLNARTLKSIDRFLVGERVLLGFNSDTRWIEIVTDNVTYRMIATDGDYPKIRSLFPEQVTASFEVDQAVLKESVKVAQFMSERFAPCYISLRESGADVEFANGIFGPSKSPVAAASLMAGDSEPIKFAMNPQYVLDALQQIGGERVRISYTEVNKPFMFTAAGVGSAEANVHKHLFMSVRMPS